MWPTQNQIGISVARRLQRVLHPCFTWNYAGYVQITNICSFPCIDRAIRSYGSFCQRLLKNLPVMAYSSSLVGDLTLSFEEFGAFCPLESVVWVLLVL